MTRQARVVVKSATANVVREMVDNNKRNKTQEEIALEIGFKGSNVLTMIKQGRTRMPIDKVGSLAKACGYAPDRLVRAVLREYMPEFGQALTQVVQMPMFEDAEEVVAVFNDAMAESIAKAQDEQSSSAADESKRIQATRLSAKLDLDDQNKLELKRFVKTHLVKITEGDDVIDLLAARANAE